MKKIELLEKVKQLEGLTSDEKASLINLINTKKKYGLVWEDKPEDVEEQLRTKLPVLKEVKERAIVNDTEEESYPNHILIEGDNLHALTALTFTHEGRIDLIYIDPPYNTGNKDFIYNDHYVDKLDSYRHSKWLSFLHKRLQIAHKVLADNGVIFISIDDNEEAQLKILCDEIFGANNFIAKMIWQQGKKSSGNLIGINHEYMLVYAKCRENIDKPELAWKQKKEGLNKIYLQYDKLKRKFKVDFKSIEREMKTWFGSLTENDPAYASKHYSMVDEKGLFFADNSCAPDRPETRCHKSLIHPITKKETAVPSLGWRWKEETLDKMVLENRFYYGQDENTVPKVKKYLKDMESELPSTVFYKDGRGASSELAGILGKKIFNNPKDRTEIARILNFRMNSIILDFFAGSGTTLHATMSLNLKDNGARQCILVTDNENNIAKEVTYERNKRVIQGYINAKGQKIEGLKNNNLRYYQCDFVERKPIITNKRKLTRLATELLCIKEDTYNECTSTVITEKQDWIKFFNNHNAQYLCIVYDDMKIEQAVEILQSLIETKKPDKKIKVYVFSNGQYPYTEDFEEVLNHITLTALPDAIYKAYQNVLPKKQKMLVPEIEEPSAEETEKALETGEPDLFNQPVE
jgi:adenine-specific DNA-methyltransferase